MRRYTGQKRQMDGPDTRFFGYGSLVNRATHGYPQPRQASLHGWRRLWVHVASRPVAFLSVEPAPEGHILGLVADVPDGDWAALDKREAAYARHPVTAHVEGGTLAVQVYAVPHEDRLPPSDAHPLLLSYIDTVVQGFLREFGPEGARHFFQTTHGWYAPILNDRAAPRYPRAQRLSARERAAVDAGLAHVGARPVPDHAAGSASFPTPGPFPF